MTRYNILPVSTEYWKPGQNYIEEIVRCINGKVVDGDFIVISEKAISTAVGNIVDESCIEPGLNARFIATFWMHTVWGYFLGPLCHSRRKRLQRIREYPEEKGSRHKQVALRYTGLLQALLLWSEGGIDGSNLPYSFVSLPLNEARTMAEAIRKQIRVKLGKKVCVMIADTDKTYSFRNFHFTPRPKPISGIYSCGGVAAYVVGRFFKLKQRSTPLAAVGYRMTAEDALQIAELANRFRGSGAGPTVWDMAAKFNVALTDVSWKMLETVKHKPIVIVRSRR